MQRVADRADQAGDIEANIRGYLQGRMPQERDASFDYCFNYFQTFREQHTVEQMASPAHLRESCFQLGFYLASWGMLRGSSFLSKKSAKFYVPIIETIANANPLLWDIDAHCYTTDNIALILTFKEEVAQALGKTNNPSDILVTKIMLGVFGNVPAFDDYFTKGFSVSSFGKRALEEVAHFYEARKAVIEQFRVPTLDFETGQPTRRLYSRAKIIDMNFFIAGGGGRKSPAGGVAP